MKTVLLSLFIGLTFFCAAQQPNWGFGEPITVTGTSSITCTVTDPITHQTESTTQSGVANFINSDGVVAYVTPGGTVGGVIYDVNRHSFENGTFSSNSGNTISNADGVIAYVSSAGTVGGATYDVCRQSWESSTLSSNAGNTVINRQGVIAYVSSAGTVGGAIYDPHRQSWESSTLSSNAGNSIQNREGIISYVSSAGTVGGGTYDISTHSWESTTLSSNAGNTVVNKNGVIAYISSAGTVGGAVYDFNSRSWDDATFSSSGSNSGLTITDGTVKWTNSNGNQSEGYSGGSWSSGSSTSLSCRFVAEVPGCYANGTAYFWCMSIGADDYSYDTDEGHTISRRWGWKQYDPTGGSYSPHLTISNNTQNSGCSSSVDIVSGITPVAANYFKLVPNPATDRLKLSSNGHSFHEVKIYNTLGQEVYSNTLDNASLEMTIDISNIDRGVYFLKVSGENNTSAVKKFIKD